MTDQNFVDEDLDEDLDKDVASQTGVVDKIKTSVKASTSTDQVILIVYDFTLIIRL